MVATRQDAWTEDDDLLLAEVTLRHIREGGTQLSAFEEVGEKLNRTPAACGFRWNSLVRKKYEAAIQIAKAQRKNRAYQKTLKNVNSESSEEIAIDYEKPEAVDETISFDSIIRFLKKQKALTSDATKHYKMLEKEIEQKNKELEQLRKENKEFKERINYLESDYNVVNEDYKALIQIMDRARKMAFLNEKEESKPTFKMDLNGNLERIDK